MPKLACRCGNVINLSEVPNPDGYLLLAERDWDAIDDSSLGEDVAAYLMRRSMQTYLCPRCGRLIIFRDAGPARAPAFYLPEPE